MSDLHNRFRTVDRMRSPDLWSEITERAERAPQVNRFVPLALGATAVVVVALLGLQLLIGGGVTGPGPAIEPSPTPTAIPSPAADAPSPPESVAPLTPSLGRVRPDGSGEVVQEGELDAGTYFWVMLNTFDGPMNCGGGKACRGVEFTVPEGWRWNGWYLSKGGVDAPDGAVIAFLPPPGLVSVYADPCHWAEAAPQSFSGGLPLLEALAAQPMVDATTPTERNALTIFSRMGARTGSGIEVALLTLSDVNLADCDLGTFRRWSFDWGAEFNPPYRPQQGMRELVWALKSPTRLVINSVYFPGTPDSVIDEIQFILDSITLGGLLG